MFSRIFYASCLAGLLGGLLLTGLQTLGVVPLILEAERHESVASPGSAPRSAATGHGGHADDHDHGTGSWAPEDGLERTFWTAVTNVTTAIGFALLLVAILAWRGHARLRDGLLWGAVGFSVFFLNPSLGLAPELPGAQAAELADRQLWWFGTVLATAAGLGMLIVGRSPTLKVLGACLLVAPHLIGAPHPPDALGAAPQSLADRFVVQTAITNLVFWATLGLLSAVFYRRFGAGQSPEDGPAGGSGAGGDRGADPKASSQTETPTVLTAADGARR